MGPGHAWFTDAFIEYNTFPTQTAPRVFNGLTYIKPVSVPFWQVSWLTYFDSFLSSAHPYLPNVWLRSKSNTGVWARNDS
jgi:hypothetical protein